MNRSRLYYRKQRARHLRRRRRICHFYDSFAVIRDEHRNLYWSDWSHKIPFEMYERKGYYSKGKIHCSCPMCSAKTRNKGRRRKTKPYAPAINYKISDARRLDEMKYELEELE